LISVFPKSNGRGEQKLPICEPISGSQNAKLSDAIERRVLSRYSMESLDKKRGEYLLSILYTTDVELDRIIYNEIWREAESFADLRICFTEGCHFPG
jgi:hypothetical protein